MIPKPILMLPILSNPAKESNFKISKSYPKMPDIRNPWILHISLVLLLVELNLFSSFEPLTQLGFILLPTLVLEDVPS